VLHVTNGDAAVPSLRAAGVEGDVLPWREVLHDGPVPAGLGSAELREVRACFLARDDHTTRQEALGSLQARDARLDDAARSDEAVTLWFEADLYDILLLLQVVDRLSEHGPLRLVLVGQDEWRSVNDVRPEELAALGRTAPPVTREQRALARTAWAAFTAPDPAGLCELARGTPALPAIGEGLHRLLQEYPSTNSGLSRTERQLLEAVGAGAGTREAAFQAAIQAEERPFLGDATAWNVLERLAPLLDGAGLSERGRAVLGGREMWSSAEERWIGGVRLPPGRAPWRWDPGAGTLV
jgi:Domain of unknown function (DUF1835)